jgi:hypothetical protein
MLEKMKICISVQKSYQYETPRPKKEQMYRNTVNKSINKFINKQINELLLVS